MNKRVYLKKNPETYVYRAENATYLVINTQDDNPRGKFDVLLMTPGDPISIGKELNQHTCRDVIDAYENEFKRSGLTNSVKDAKKVAATVIESRRAKRWVTAA